MISTNTESGQRVWANLTVTTTGTALAFSSSGLPCSKALAMNTGASDITIGPDSSANARTLSPGDEYEISVERGWFDLSDWYADGTAGGTLVVLYLI